MLGEAAVLASAGATALVTAMVTDGWEAIRTRVARLLGRGEAERERAISMELDTSKAALIRDGAGMAAPARLAEEEAWRIRLVAMLEHDPSAATELWAIVAQVRGPVVEAAGVELHAEAHDQAQQANLGTGVMNVTFGAPRGRDGS